MPSLDEDPRHSPSVEFSSAQPTRSPAQQMPSRCSSDSLRPQGSSNTRDTTATSTSEAPRAPPPAAEVADARWEAMVHGLVDYQRRHGTLHVPRDYRWNDRSLYEWCRNQRKHYLNGIRGRTPALLPRRRARLEAIGFELDPTGAQGENDAFDDRRWVAMFEGLVRFRRQYGSFAVPIGYQCDGRSLHDWMRHQRKQYALTTDGGRAAMSGARIDRLLSIGFDLDAAGRRQDRRTDEERWDVMFEGLREYQLRHGSLIADAATHDGRSLRAWAQNQRRLYVNFFRNQQPALSREQAVRLQSLGFVLPPQDPAPSGDKASVGARALPHSVTEPFAAKAASPRRTRPRSAGATVEQATDEGGGGKSAARRASLSREAVRLAQSALAEYQRQRGWQQQQQQQRKGS